MDRKSIIILIVCFALLMLWFPLVRKLYPPNPASRGTNSLAGATNQIERLPASSPAASPAIAPSLRAPELPVPASVKEDLVTITNDNARYTFTSHGGGLKLVELSKYLETVGCNRQQKENRLAQLNADAPVPVLALTGGEALEGDGVFQLTRTAGIVRAEKQLSNGLYLVKEFQLSTNYLVRAQVRLENHSAQPLALPAQTWSVGTATPMGPLDNEQFAGVYWFDGARDTHRDKAWFDNSRFGGCIPGVQSTPRTQYAAGPSHVAWTAVHNQFFLVAVMPATSGSDFVAYRIDLPPPTPAVMADYPQANARPIGLQAGLVYPATNLPPGQVWSQQFSIYAGPKVNHILEEVATQYNNRLDLVMAYSGFFGWFAKALLSAMNGLHALGLGYAWAIIAITVTIKLLFWPLTQASTRSMKRMQSLQPQIKALQAKYKDDPAKQQRKMMEFWKEHKINPLGGCLPMVLQLPVFIGFFTMVRSAIELRGARFLWACDLSKSDTLFIIPGLNFPFNLLPLLMGVTMLWQARLTPASPGMDPAQQKIYKYMPLIFLVILYNYSAGLTLYWTVQNLLTIAQMKLTRAKDASAGPAPAPAIIPRKKK
jgi:YidC/Oxa1 family membrane protein insertase